MAAAESENDVSTRDIREWHTLNQHLSGELSITPLGREPFGASRQGFTLGPLSLRHTRSSPVTLTMSAAATQRPGARYFILQCLAGHLQLEAGGETSTLAPGDMTLLHAGSQLRLVAAERHETLTVGCPGDILSTHLPEPGLFVGTLIPGTSAQGRMASGMLRHLLTACAEGLHPETGYRLANCMLEMFTICALSEEVLGTDRRSRRQLNRLRAKRFVELHLGDPQLTPALIADRLHLSARYLRKLFEDEGTTLSRYILSRRLQACADQLRADQAGVSTLTNLAFSLGFSSMAHFSRCFRVQFGMTARAYRALHGSGAGNPAPELFELPAATG